MASNGLQKNFKIERARTKDWSLPVFRQLWTKTFHSQKFFILIVSEQETHRNDKSFLFDGYSFLKYLKIF